VNKNIIGKVIGYTKIFSLERVSMQEENGFRKAMVVMAHADDAEYGVSGTVAKWRAEGWDVVYVICTDGSKGSSDPKITQKQLSEIRRKEQIAAGRVLGLKNIVFLGYEDSLLQPTLGLRKDITREIRRSKPDILICMYPMRNLDGHWGFGHPDHMASGEAAMSAVFPTARDHMTFPELLEEGLETHKVSEVWIVGHPEPNHWVDVSGFIDTAAKALAQHKSQVEHPYKKIREMMGNWRRKTATGRGMEYAEAYKKIVFEQPKTDNS
jgi:LmbE family N-acetylglucosaminyl deacetylase